MMNIFNIGQNQSKFDYELKIHHATKLLKSGFLTYVSWKCGRKNRGETKRTLVKDRTALWDETFRFKTSMSKKNQKYRSKTVYLSIYEVGKERKKSILLGELSLNLAEYTSIYNEDFSSTKTFSFKQSTVDGETEAKIKISIKSSFHVSNGDTDNSTSVSEFTSDDMTFDCSERGSSSRKDNSSSQRISRRRKILQKLNEGSRFESSLSDEEVSSFDHRLGRSRASSKSESIRYSSSNEDDYSSDDTADDTSNTSLTKTDSDSEDEDSTTSTTSSSGGKATKQDSRARANSTKLPNNRRSSTATTIDDVKGMKEKILKLQQESNERYIIDTLIGSRRPEFNGDLPIAAPLLVKVLRQWDCFAKRSHFPFRIITAIHQVLVDERSNKDLLCYWLGNGFMLQHLLNKEYGELDLEGCSASESFTISLPSDTNLSPDSQVLLKVSDNNGNEEGISEENKEDTTLSVETFKLASASITHKVYKSLIQHLYTSLISVLVPSMFHSISKTRPVTSSAVVDILKQFRSHLTLNQVFDDVIHQFFEQAFRFINSYCFLALLDPKAKRCRVGSVLILKMAITQLEAWVFENEMHQCIDFLKPLRQACTIILINNKSSLVKKEVRMEICPCLSLPLIRKILQSYQPDEYDDSIVPSSVLKSLTASIKKGGQTDAASKYVLEFDPRIVRSLSFNTREEFRDWKMVRAPKELWSHEGLEFLKHGANKLETL